jgi:glycosyltransferase involved in cell wall biosynthesis
MIERAFVNVILVRAVYANDPLNGNDLRLWHLIYPERNRAAVVAGRRDILKETPLRWPGPMRLEAALEEIRPGWWELSPKKFLQRHVDRLERVRRSVGAARSEPGWENAAVVASGHCAALALCTRPKGEQPFVFELCDSMGLYFFRRWQGLRVRQPLKAMNAWWMSRVYLNLELFISRHASAITVASAVDAVFLQSRGASCKVDAILNGTDWVDAAPADPSADDQRVVFHGNMGWEPNRVAAVYLAGEVMPRLRAMAPEATLEVAGGPIFPELMQFEGKHGVRVLGRVDDIQGVLRRAQVYAMPMFQGAGFKNKLAEAMAMGLPVVTNRMGAEALDTDGQALVACAETPDAIARRLGELLKDSARRGKVGRASREYARTHFGWEARRQEFQTILEGAAGGKMAAGGG